MFTVSNTAKLAALTLLMSMAVACQKSATSLDGSAATASPANTSGKNPTNLNNNITGGTSGGGGKGVVCRDSSGTIQSVEVLDLWEARVLKHKTIVPSDLPVRQQIDNALIKLSTALPETVLNDDALGTMSSGAGATPAETKTSGKAALLSQLRRSVIYKFYENVDPSQDYDPKIFLPGIRLLLTSDSFENATPDNCAVEQIVRYSDLDGDQPIMGSLDLWEKMNSVNKAALIAHEVFYKFLRENFKEKSSLRVRRTIGLVFAGEDMTSTTMADLPEKLGVCNSLDPDDVKWHVINPAMPTRMIYFFKDGCMHQLEERVLGLVAINDQGPRAQTSCMPIPTVEEYLHLYYQMAGHDPGGKEPNTTDLISGDFTWYALNIPDRDGKNFGIYFQMTASPIQTEPSRFDRVKCSIINKKDFKPGFTTNM